MKTYLNSEERKDMVMLFSLIGMLKEGFLEGWYKRGNLTKEEKKYMKSSITFALKVTDSIMSRIDGNLAQRLIRDIKSTELFCLPKSEATIKKERFEKEENFNYFIQVTKDAIDALAEKALYWCNPCSVEDCSKCEVRQIFRELDVEPFDYEARECEYRISKLNRGGDRDE